MGSSTNYLWFDGVIGNHHAYIILGEDAYYDLSVDYFETIKYVLDNEFQIYNLYNYPGAVLCLN